MTFDNVSWIAFLSSGQSINEEDLYVPGEESPFKKLVRYTVKNNLVINAVTVTVKGIRYNSPSLSERGNFVSPVKPERFWVCYRDRYFPFQKENYTFIGLSWKANDCRTILWIGTNSENPISWIEINNLDTSLEELINKYYNGVE